MLPIGEGAEIQISACERTYDKSKEHEHRRNGVLQSGEQVHRMPYNPGVMMDLHIVNKMQTRLI